MKTRTHSLGWICLICLALLVVTPGCDDGNGNLIVPVTLTTGSGLFVVDCNSQRAYVPLIRSADPNTGNGRVAIIDLSLDPNVADPRLATVVLSHQDNPTGAAISETDNLVALVSGRSDEGGFIDLIDTLTNQLTSDSPIPFPAGMEPGSTGQVLFDPVRKVMIISVTSNSACQTPNCTGFITFDLITRAFGNYIASNYSETFAFNAKTNVIVNASDDDNSGEIGLVDLNLEQDCLLSDENIGGDSDGASIDFDSNIAVISNEDGTATAINLNGSTFSGTAPSCVVSEGGSPPNSILLNGLTGDPAGSAINPATHEAFVIEDGDDGISLIGLPAAPVGQLTEGMISQSTSNIPQDPDGSTFRTQGDPYAVAIDVCNNLGFAIDDSSRWLVSVDLSVLKNSSSSIDTSLPAGNCAGTSTTKGCNNANGVIFYPLPPVGFNAN